MKREINRIIKEPFLWILIICSFFSVLMLSYYYINRRTPYYSFGIHDVKAYNNPEELQSQIESYQYIIKGDIISSQDKKFIEETIEVMQYLQDKKMNYYNVFEIDGIWEYADSPLAYVTQNSIWLYALFLIIHLTLTVIVCYSGKISKTDLILYTMYPRKKILIQRKHALLFLDFSLCIFLLVLVELVCQLFDSDRQMVLLYSSTQGVYAVNAILYRYLIYISLFISSLYNLLIYFIISMTKISTSFAIIVMILLSVLSIFALTNNEGGFVAAFSVSMICFSFMSTLPIIIYISICICKMIALVLLGRIVLNKHLIIDVF